MAEPYLGDIMVFAGNFAPRGWAICDGSLLPISLNVALFSLLGTTYGGNGTTNFGLPDLRGRMPLKFGSLAGQSFPQGASGGVETVTVNNNQVPSHTHTARASSAPGTSPSPISNVWANATSSLPYAATSDVSMAPTNTTGNGVPHANRQPYLGMYIVICIDGLYPPRP